MVARAYERRLLTGLSFREFSKIRLIRLYPLIAFAVLVSFVIQAVPKLSIAPNFIRLDAQSWFYQAFLACALLIPFPYFPNGSPGTFFPANPPIWSLMFEFAANAIYAGFSRFLKTYILLVIVLLGATGICLVGKHFNSLDVGFYTGTAWGGWIRVLFSFFLGVLIFRLMTPRLVDRLPRLPPLFLVIALITIVAIRPFPGDWILDAISVIVFFPTILILSFPDISGPRVRRIFFLFGALSYPIYLLHKPLEAMFLPWLKSISLFKTHNPLQISTLLLVEFMMIFGTSLIVLRLYDTPIRTWLSDRTRARPAN